MILAMYRLHLRPSKRVSTVAAGSVLQSSLIGSDGWKALGTVAVGGLNAGDLAWLVCPTSIRWHTEGPRSVCLSNSAEKENQWKPVYTFFLHICGKREIVTRNWGVSLWRLRSPTICCLLARGQESQWYGSIQVQRLEDQGPEGVDPAEGQAVRSHVASAFLFPLCSGPSSIVVAHPCGRLICFTEPTGSSASLDTQGQSSGHVKLTFTHCGAPCI